MVEALVLNRPKHLPSVKGLRVIELGSGIGLLGTSLAWAGAEVLLTDLPTLVWNATEPNLERNADPTSKPPPEWLDNSNAYSIGDGWAAAKPLDWSKSVQEQLSLDQLNVDLIVASDCAWLASMLDMLLDTVESLLNTGASSFLMAFQRREKNIGSATFTTEDHLAKVVEKRGLILVPMAWRPITLVDQTETIVCLVKISK